jgi:NADH:ubiquinone oxidoreductase subunit K
MTELLRTNDAVLITAIEALLSGAKIEFVVADRHMSALEGSIGALPRRVLVPADKVVKARRVLTEGGLGHALPPG